MLQSRGQYLAHFHQPERAAAAFKEAKPIRVTIAGNAVRADSEEQAPYRLLEVRSFYEV